MKPSQSDVKQIGWVEASKAKNYLWFDTHEVEDRFDRIMQEK